MRLSTPTIRLDFARPFLPQAPGAVCFAGLAGAERLALNQIGGHSYLCLRDAVEVFSLGFVLDHVRPRLRGDPRRVSRLLDRAARCAEHRARLARLRAAYVDGAGDSPPFAGTDEIPHEVLASHPLTVAMALAGLARSAELRDVTDLEHRFAHLLRDEAAEAARQRAAIAGVIDDLSAVCSARERAAAVVELETIAGAFDDLLRRQAGLDLESLEERIGRRLPPAELAGLTRQHFRALRWALMGPGLTPPDRPNPDKET